jgi:hypothetical protein
MNLMHENLQVTDGIYAILSDNEIKERINHLSKNEQTEEKTIMKIEQLLSDIKKVS